MKVKIGDFLKRIKDSTDIDDSIEYKRVTIKMNNGGVFLRDLAKGYSIGTKKQFRIASGQFILSKIDARNGAFGVVGDNLEGAIITGNFWTYQIDKSRINIDWFSLFVSSRNFRDICSRASSGTTNRKYLQEDKFLNIEIELPDVTVQKQLISKLAHFQLKAAKLVFNLSQLEKLLTNAYHHIEKKYSMEFGPLGKYLVNKTEQIGNSYSGKNKIGVSNDTGITELRTSKNVDLERYKIVEKMSFVYNPMRINVGSIGLYEDDTISITSPDYVVFQTKKYPEQYLLHYLKSPNGMSEIRKNTKGSVRERLYFSNLLNILGPSFKEDDYEKLNQLFDSVSKLESLIQKSKLQLDSIRSYASAQIFVKDTL